MMDIRMLKSLSKKYGFAAAVVTLEAKLPKEFWASLSIEELAQVQVSFLYKKRRLLIRATLEVYCHKVESITGSVIFSHQLNSATHLFCQSNVNIWLIAKN